MDEAKQQQFEDMIQTARQKMSESCAMVRDIMLTDAQGDFADKFGMFLHELHQSGESEESSNDDVERLAGTLSRFTALMADLGYSVVMANLASAILEKNEASKQDAQQAAEPQVEVVGE